MHNIPRIQYLNLDTLCVTTNTLPTLNNIDDTTDIVAGMFARGTGIPSGAKVLSKTINSVTLDKNCTATGVDIAVSFGFEILFDFPPIEENAEKFTNNSNVSESLSGVRQVSTNYIEGVRSLGFDFVSDAIYQLMATFLTTHALLGNEFRYYDDQTSNSYVVVELSDLKVQPVKRFPKGENTFVWAIPITLRRVL